MNSKKRGLILLSLFLFAFLLSGFCFAQEERPLEIEYPRIPGAEIPTTTKTALPQYVKYIFNLSILIAGLVAFGAMIYGGVRYLTSAGDPTKMRDAKEQIFAGILGLIILFSSYLILTTINPQLVILRLELEEKPPVPEAAGVKLCITEGGEEKCVIYTSDQATLGEFNNKGPNLSVTFNNLGELIYGVVLHEDENFRGECAVCLSGNCQEKISKMKGDGVSSITVFLQGSSSGEGVILYECKEYNKECGAECYRTCPSSPCGDDCVTEWRWKVIPHPRGGKCWGPFTNEKDPKNLGEKGRSIEINPEGGYLAVLFERTNGTGKCEVFRKSDPDLASNYIGICGGLSNLGCFGSIIVLPIK